jgi:SseB protein N-terminal domain
MNGSSENTLHEALKRSRKSAMARREFLAFLLESEVHVIGRKDGDCVHIASTERDGRRRIPIFTSSEELQKHAREAVSMLTMTGRTLMEMTRGANLVGDPSSSDWNEFTAEEIAKLLETGPTHKIVVK